MICAKHPDGRIILLASELNLKPMLFYPQGKNWEAATINSEDLISFIEIKERSLINLLLLDAKQFAEKNPEFKIL